MYLDVSAHVGHWPFQKTAAGSCRALLDRMNQYGVERSVVGHMHGIFYKNAQSANEELYEEIRSDRRFPGRLIPFAVLNPNYAGWKKDLEDCRTRMGMKGIRLYPLYHDYELLDPGCLELVRMAGECGLPVAIPLRMVDSRSRSWMDVRKELALKDLIPLIREVPGARFLLLNVANGIRLKEEELRFFRESKVLLDTSGRNISDLGELIGKFGKDKFAFGTHTPILDYATGMLRIESLQHGEADEPAMEMLRSGNARRFLEI